MAIPSSGSLAFSAIQTEFGGSNPISMSEYYAGGDNVASGTSGDSGTIPSTGTIALSEFYGSTARVAITLTISSNTANYSIYSNKGGTYSAGFADITLVNNAVVSSSSTGTAALDTGSGWTSGDTITIDNNSTIVGDGGDGGAGGAVSGSTVAAAVAGGAGGNAVNLQYAVTIDNTGGTISGGGGGGGGGGSTYKELALGASDIQGGDGGGGGFGGGAAGAGGVASGGNGTAGAAGSVSAAGAGGGTAGHAYSGGAGGAAGGAGTAGTLGSTETSNGAVGAGGAAGKAVNLNSNSITWTANGTRNGAIS